MSDDTPTQRFEPEGNDAPTQKFDAAAANGASEEVVEERKNRKVMIILGIVGGALLLAVIILLIFLLVKPGSGTGGLPTGSSSPTATRSSTPTPTATQSSTPTPTPTQSSRTPIIVLSIVGSVLIAAVITILVVFASRIGGEAPLATLAPPVQTNAALPSPTASAPPDEQPEATAPRFTFFTATTEVQCPPDGDKPEVEFSWETTGAVEVWYTAKDEDAVDDRYLQVPLNGNQADLTDEHLFPCAHDEFQDYTVTMLGANGEHVSEHFRVTDLNWNTAGGEGGNELR